MAGELMRDLPGDLPTFLARFGSDATRSAGSIWRWAAGPMDFAALAAATGAPTATMCG
jgi:hypothetical protein